MRLQTIADAYGSDVTSDYELHIIDNDGGNYVYLTHIGGHSGGSPYALYFRDMDPFNYKLLYRTNDPTNQATADYWENGDMLRILNVPDKFDGFIIAQ